MLLVQRVLAMNRATLLLSSTSLLVLTGSLWGILAQPDADDSDGSAALPMNQGPAADSSAEHEVRGASHEVVPGREVAKNARPSDSVDERDTPDAQLGLPSFEDKYAGLAPSDLRIVAVDLKRIFRAQTEPVYQARFESGDYETVYHGEPGAKIELNQFHLGDDPYSIRFKPNGEVRRVGLSRAEFPLVWEVWQEVKWLDSEIRGSGGRLARLAHGRALS